jgi:Ca-activated chloride channel homolog
MRFENAHLLWLLLVLPPALLLFFWRATRQRRKLLQQFIQARLLNALTVGVSTRRRKIRFALLILAVAGLIIALARPQYGFDLQKVEQRGLDIVVAIDTSKSMLAEDITPDRLERAKMAALDLMQLAKPDRLGLVAFAGDAYLECPLTFDNTAFQQSVQALTVNSLPQGGTAIAQAIKTAQTAFKESDDHKILVLLTDGEDHDSGALAAAKAAAKAGLKIFTVGIGTTQGALLRITDANGNSDYIRDANGDVVKSHLNAALLKQIASAAGGFYLPLRPNTMQILYDKGLKPLPKSVSQERMLRRYHEQYHWPLAAAILLLLAEMFLPERKRAAKTAGTTAKPGVAKIAGLLLVLCLLPNVILASPASALRDYQTGDYTNALAEFDRLAEVDTNDLRLVFDAGTAAYRATNFDEALQDFQAATMSQDLNLQQRAYYNMGNTYYRLGELKLAPTTEGLDDTEQAWRQAVKSYEHAAELDTNDVDTAYNLNFVKKRVELIDELREAMRRAKMEADNAVRRSEFHRALEIMESLHNPIATKKFKDFIQKLKQIDEIDTPNQS